MHSVRVQVTVLILAVLLAGGGVFVVSSLLGQQDHLQSEQTRADTERARISADRARVAAALVTAQRDACERANAVRDELNARNRAHSIDRAVLLQALKLAATGGPLHKAFAHLREIERRYVHFRVVKHIDCNARAAQIRKTTQPHKTKQP